MLIKDSKGVRGCAGTVLHLSEARAVWPQPPAAAGAFAKDANVVMPVQYLEPYAQRAHFNYVRDAPDKFMGTWATQQIGAERLAPGTGPKFTGCVDYAMNGREPVPRGKLKSIVTVQPQHAEEALRQSNIKGGYVYLHTSNPDLKTYPLGEAITAAEAKRRESLAPSDWESYRSRRASA